MQDVHARLIGKHFPRTLDHCWVDVDAPYIGLVKVIVPNLQRLAQRHANFGNISHAIADRLEQRVIQISVFVIIMTFVGAICADGIRNT